MALVPQYSFDGGQTWHGAQDVISQGYAVDGTPKYNSYTAPLFADVTKSPLKEYLAGEVDGFLARVQIQGGVFDGVSETASWPAQYEFTPPPTVGNGEDGAGGNRGDAGSGNTDQGGDRDHLPNGGPNQNQALANGDLHGGTVTVEQAGAPTLNDQNTAQNPSKEQTTSNKEHPPKREKPSRTPAVLAVATGCALGGSALYMRKAGRKNKPN